MVIAHINTVAFGSTGRIMFDLAEAARAEGHTVYTYSALSFRRGRTIDCPPRAFHSYYGSKAASFLHKALGGLTGFNGVFSVFATWRLLRQLKAQRVELIHLHNLHEFCVNLPMLFGFIKRHGIRVVWTLHDCWSFTGHCAHFSMLGCNKWKSGCGACPQKAVYPRTVLDTTRFMWKRKRRWFNGVKDLTLVAPSAWLAGLAAQSFLSAYPVRVIHNGVDLRVFKPSPSSFRKERGLEGKRVLLGVSLGWNSRKGLDVFIALSQRLDERYRIVLVGTDDVCDRQLPAKILSIHRTQSQQELAELYTAADLFINPTREETYPTVNMEAIACGTPVVTFQTGGSPEILDHRTGAVVPRDDLDALVREIERIFADKPFRAEDCAQRALSFDPKNTYAAYLRLYEA